MMQILISQLIQPDACLFTRQRLDSYENIIQATSEAVSVGRGQC